MGPSALRPPLEAPPHAVPAPPPWEAERELPFEPEPVPQRRPCRRCGRIDRRLEAELVAAYQALGELEDLLVWLGEEHRLGSEHREEAEREIAALQALLREFDDLASGHDAALAAGRRAVAAANRRRREAERLAAAERERASRLALEVKRLKDRRDAPGGGAAGADLALAAFAAAEASETDGRLLALEGELKREREKTGRYARYVEALEARLRRLADDPEREGGASEATALARFARTSAA